VSYIRLLRTAVSEYAEDILPDDPSLTDVIKQYDTLEKPGKIEALVGLVEDLRDQGQKVVIWSNFIETLRLIRATMRKCGHRAHLIYGATPTEKGSIGEELTREKMISEFVDRDSGIDILVANPAACAESISLHKTCSNAIYYDLSYNSAQYIQSMDRIHRVGGSEHTPAHYHFLQYNESIDRDILSNVRGKADNMAALIDRDYPIYSLDMFAEDEELEAYERLFGK
jgi:SNF2 family DNA or RNA helicase